MTKEEIILANQEFLFPAVFTKPDKNPEKNQGRRPQFPISAGSNLTSTYWCRSASAGAIAEARCAGTNVATPATSVAITATPAKVAGSFDCTP